MTARGLIMVADQIAREKGLNQMQWSAQAGHSKSGQTVSRIVSKGNCRLSTFIELLLPLGCELQIVEIDTNKRA